MGCKRLNPMRAKIHRTYTVEETARLYGVHRRTVRNWIAEGLLVLRAQKPHLIPGRDLKDFLKSRRQSARRPCRPGELFCLRCRQPRPPDGDMLDYLPITPTLGNFRGICPACETFMHRRVSRAKIDAVSGLCAVAYPQGQERLAGSSAPSLDCHLAAVSNDHDKAQ